MKFIRKGSEPASLIAFKAMANEDWTPSYGNLDLQVKRDLEAALLEEQGHICCYCERELLEGDFHIEHFRPQSLFPEQNLVFSNLLCSCLNKLGRKEPRHCGVLKDNWFDEESLISPTTPDCETRFTYTGDGRIYAAKGDSAAGISRQRLGLDIPKLVAMRKKVIEVFLDPNLSDQKFLEFVRDYQNRDSNGRFGPFVTTIKHLFQEKADL